MIWVERHHSYNNLDFIAQTLDECWTQWAVDQTTGKNCIL